MIQRQFLSPRVCSTAVNVRKLITSVYMKSTDGSSGGEATTTIHSNANQFLDGTDGNRHVHEIESIPHHDYIDTSKFQRIILSIGSSIAALVNPHRLTSFSFNSLPFMSFISVWLWFVSFSPQFWMKKTWSSTMQTKKIVQLSSEMNNFLHGDEANIRTPVYTHSTVMFCYVLSMLICLHLIKNSANIFFCHRYKNQFFKSILTAWPRTLQLHFNVHVYFIVPASFDAWCIAHDVVVFIGDFKWLHPM